MKKVTLVLKGNARIMCFGKVGWGMKNAGRPVCDSVFVGFTKLDSIMYAGREMKGEMGSLMVPRVLKHVNGDRLSVLGEHLLSFDDVENVELPVILEVEDDFNIADLYLMKDVNSFEGCDVFYMSNAFYLFDSIDMNEVSGDIDIFRTLNGAVRTTLAELLWQ